MKNNNFCYEDGEAPLTPQGWLRKLVRLVGLVWGLRSKQVWTQNMPVVTTRAFPAGRRAAPRYIHLEVKISFVPPQKRVLLLTSFQAHMHSLGGICSE